MYQFAKFVAWLISFLSFKTLEKVSNFCAFVFFDILRIRRRLMLKNLDIAFGETKTRAEKLSIARASYSQFMQTILEVLISKRHPIDADIEIIGGENIHAALSQNKGAYIICFHMGNWEAMGAVVSNRFRPAFTAVKKVGGDGLNRFVEERRKENGLYWIPRTNPGDAVRQMVKILRRGEIVGFIMDQARPGEPRLPFFSKDAKTNTSLAAICQRFPAPVLVIYIYRKKFGSHVLTCLPELELKDSGDKKQDVLDNSLLFNQQVEAAVRLHPEHYFWFHNRWK